MDELLSVFVRARDALSRSANDFGWSSWRDMNEALLEIDSIIGQLRTGVLPDVLRMKVLFGPTGPIQEVSLSSGWGNKFLKLAEDFDAALERVQG